MQVKQTKDYSIFKRFNANRLVNKNHQKNLANAIRQKNLLHLFPIVCNEGMEIIDGQHRLAAAMDLGVPVFYIVDGNVSKADIAMVNNNRKSWSVRDYINFHEKEGVEAYVKLNSLLSSYPKLTVMCAVKLMRPDIKSYYDSSKGVGGGNDSQKVKAGQIVADHYRHAKDACEVARKLHLKVHYIFRPDLVLEIKRGMLENRLTEEKASKLLQDSIRMFPKAVVNYELTANRLIRQVLSKKQF